jgi:molybdopterin molybdotransferase
MHADSSSSASAHSPADAVERFVRALDAFARADVLGQESVDLADAAGRTLADSLRSDRDSPAIDVSAMDGYALRHADLVRGSLPIAGEVRIGHAPPSLAPGSTLRIVTGAPIPPGADTILKREDVSEAPDRITWSSDRHAACRVGDHIRRRGENGAAGTLIAEAGTTITPALLGALASFGVVRPRVLRRLRIAILSTGDEVLPPSTATLEPWQLRDSNGPTLAAFFRQASFVDSVTTRHAIDDNDALDAAVGDLLERSAERADALLLTGGVSMGHRDLVPATLARHGVRTLFHRVPQRPGKPILGGVTDDGRPVFGLPGNPVSVLVTARRIAWPVLRHVAGVNSDGSGDAGSADALVHLDAPDEKRIPLWWHRLVRVTGPGTAALADLRGSGDVVGAARSDGFIECPPDACGAGPWPLYRWATR